MKFYQFLCQFVKISPFFPESLEKSLDKVVSRGEKNFGVHKKYMNFFQYRKTALDEHLYKLSAGRSMVEMLTFRRKKYGRNAGCSCYHWHSIGWRYIRLL